MDGAGLVDPDNPAQSDHPYFLIDGPGPFSPIEELLAFRAECRAMLARYPNHLQWQAELEAVDQAINER